jgi:hypothetical protein
LKRIRKEQAKSCGEELFPKLVEHQGEKPIIKDELPAIFHAEGHSPGKVQQILLDAYAGNRATLPHSIQSILDRYEIKDAAIKEVGDCSVGTACWVPLFMAGEGDPLFLQVKEARTSVLEPYAGASLFPNHGQRIVDGYRLMQPASDMFLGWTQGAGGRHYFFRQLRDVKISIRVESFGQAEMEIYARWCGRALALSHARSGNSALLSEYMGKSDPFDQAIAAFSMVYADQNESDHAALERPVRRGGGLGGRARVRVAIPERKPKEHAGQLGRTPCAEYSVASLKHTLTLLRKMEPLNLLGHKHLGWTENGAGHQS